METVLEEIEQLLRELRVDGQTIAIIDDKIKRLNDQNVKLENLYDDIEDKIGEVEYSSDALKDVFDILFEQYNNISAMYDTFIAEYQTFGFEYTGLDGIKQAQIDFESAKNRLLESNTINSDVLKQCNELALSEYFNTTTLNDNNKTLAAHESTILDFALDIDDVENLLLTASDKMYAVKLKLDTTDMTLKNHSVESERVFEELDYVKDELETVRLNMKEEVEARRRKFESSNSTLTEVLSSLDEAKQEIQDIGTEVQAATKETIDMHFEQNKDEMMNLINETNTILDELKLPEYNGTIVTANMKTKINIILNSTSMMK